MPPGDTHKPWRPNQIGTTRRSSVPSCFETAYPRRQPDCPDPSKGLASIEALYLAYVILGKPPTGLLDNYYWKELFLEKNKSALLSFAN
jgi:pre-rRNA-processing protein TSR3